MGLIAERFPELSLQHLKLLAGIVAQERDAVVKVNRLFKTCGWGLGCLCCEAVLRKTSLLAGTASYPWLGFTREQGQAYTLTVDTVPLRVQPDIEEIRSSMPGEAQAMAKIRPVQGLMFDEPSRAEVLRLETTHATGQLVSAVTLYLFNENTGTTLDAIPLYSSSSAANESSDFRRPAQDVDTSGLYDFPPANDQTSDGEP